MLKQAQTRHALRAKPSKDQGRVLPDPASARAAALDSYRKLDGKVRVRHRVATTSDEWTITPVAERVAVASGVRTEHWVKEQQPSTPARSETRQPPTQHIRTYAVRSRSFTPKRF